MLPGLVTRALRRARVVACVLLAAGAAWGVAQSPKADEPLIRGLDHIPLAVADLDAAAERYRQLGFTLKPGRPHANGIRNQHVKFQDGTEIELITAGEARDALTREYLEHLSKGDGPAFVSFFAPDFGRVSEYLDASGMAHQQYEGTLTIAENEDLRYIFFGRRNRSATDREEHFRHANGAESLIGVWIAGDDLSAERNLLTGMGAALTDETLHVPDAVKGSAGKLPLGEVALLPGSRQLVPGRRIVGATLRVRSLRDLQQALAEGSWEMPPAVRTGHGTSMFLSPEITHGIWLEFRESSR